MKKKVILVCMLSIVLFFILMTIIISPNKKYIMKDGVMLAITMDGNPITTFPEGKDYRVSINCENGKGIFFPNEWNFAVKNISGNVICNIDYTTRTDNDRLLKEVEGKASNISLTNSVGDSETSYRYGGKQPDNWVLFNNEKWRIIGSIPVCLDSECSTKENLVKIIREESIGGLLFDSGSNSAWGSNSLYILLNNYYYGKVETAGKSVCLGRGSSDASCHFTDIGISGDINDYYGRMLKDVYWNVGVVTDNSTISSAYTLETATMSSVSSKIGLMSSSDYGFAIGASYNSVLSNLSSKTFTRENWLYGQGNEWLINGACVGNAGEVGVAGQFFPLNMSGSVRPVVYLDSNVYVVSGDGTEGNPYTLAM